MRKTKKRNNRKGFSMIEAVIAILICGSTFVVFMSVLLPTLKSEFYQRDQIMASNLAQEGIEIMRNVRDNNLKDKKDAFDPPFSTNAEKCYYVDYNTSPASRLCTRYFSVGINNSGSGLSIDTKFERNIDVKPNGDALEVVSTVRWKPSGSTTYSEVSLTDKLYPWGNKD